LFFFNFTDVAFDESTAMDMSAVFGATWPCTLVSPAFGWFRQGSFDAGPTQTFWPWAVEDAPPRTVMQTRIRKKSREEFDMKALPSGMMAVCIGHFPLREITIGADIYKTPGREAIEIYLWVRSV